MQESLLHYIWQFQYFDRKDLKTTNGESIQVFIPGHHNTHAGPDFSNARIKIGEIEWIGNVEIHVNSSGWYDHKHNNDPAYDNVVLHVVWKEDMPVTQKDQTQIPTLELHQKVDDTLLLNYKKLVFNPDTIPCSPSIATVSAITRLSMFEKALLIRLESKAVTILSAFKNNNNDWEETCYQILCKNFGFKVNADPFHALSESLPYKILMKHADKQLQLEALLFGQAGFLDEPIEEEYFKLLRREYLLLSQKFNLLPRKLNKAQWKFLRLRPANFPTIRLAQLASLIFQNKNIFSKFIEARNYKQLAGMLSVKQSQYWKHHYLFEAHIENEIPTLGISSIENIIINTVVPLMVAYGKANDNQELIDCAVTILQDVPGEDNSIIRNWGNLGIKSKTSFDSQAMIELYNNFCLRKRCLECTIGASIVRPSLS